MRKHQSMTYGCRAESFGGRNLGRVFFAVRGVVELCRVHSLAGNGRLCVGRHGALLCFDVLEWNWLRRKKLGLRIMKGSFPDDGIKPRKGTSSSSQRARHHEASKRRILIISFSVFHCHKNYFCISVVVRQCKIVLI